MEEKKLKSKQLKHGGGREETLTIHILRKSRENIAFMKEEQDSFKIEKGTFSEQKRPFGN